jgi:hypothetical protein
MTTPARCDRGGRLARGGSSLGAQLVDPRTPGGRDSRFGGNEECLRAWRVPESEPLCIDRECRVLERLWTQPRLAGRLHFEGRSRSWLRASRVVTTPVRIRPTCSASRSTPARQRIPSGRREDCLGSASRGDESSTASDNPTVRRSRWRHPMQRFGAARCETRSLLPTPAHRQNIESPSM